MKPFTIFDSPDDLDTEFKYLVHKAKDAAQHAYAPYSKFLVGAAVLMDDGNVLTGMNLENAAYPSCMCAERVVLYQAAALHPEKKILKLAVVAKRKSAKDLLPATSCGSCRQVMLEFEMKQQSPIQVVMQDQDHKWVVAASAEALLPFGFTKFNLDHTYDPSYH
jgi:cytidine deaminase